MEDHYIARRRRRHRERGLGLLELPDGGMAVPEMAPLGAHGYFIPVLDTQVENRLRDTSNLARAAQSRKETREKERADAQDAIFHDAKTIDMESWAQGFSSLFSDETPSDETATVAHTLHKTLQPRITRYVYKPSEFMPHGAAHGNSAVACAEGPAHCRLVELRKARAQHAAARSSTPAAAAPAFARADLEAHDSAAAFEGSIFESLQRDRLRAAAVFVVGVELALNEGGEAGGHGRHTWGDAEDRMVRLLLGEPVDKDESHSESQSQPALTTTLAADAAQPEAAQQARSDTGVLGEDTRQLRTSTAAFMEADGCCETDDAAAAAAAAAAAPQPLPERTGAGLRRMLTGRRQGAATVKRRALPPPPLSKQLTGLGELLSGTTQRLGMTLPTPMAAAAAAEHLTMPLSPVRTTRGGSDTRSGSWLEGDTPAAARASADAAMSTDTDNDSDADDDGAAALSPRARARERERIIRRMQRAHARSNRSGGSGGATFASDVADAAHRALAAVARLGADADASSRWDPVVEGAARGEAALVAAALARAQRRPHLSARWADRAHSARGVTAAFAAAVALVEVEAALRVHGWRERRAVRIAADARRARRRGHAAAAGTRHAGGGGGGGDAHSDLPELAAHSPIVSPVPAALSWASGALDGTARELRGRRSRLLSVIEALAAAGADLGCACACGSAGVEGWGLMHVCACAGDWRRIRWLSARGVSASQEDRSQRTPLMVAARGGHRYAAVTLLACGASLSAHDAEGATALHHAAGAGAATVKALLIAGADRDSADRLGETPMDYAARNERKASLDVLRVYRAPPAPVRVFLEHMARRVGGGGDGGGGARAAQHRVEVAVGGGGEPASGVRERARGARAL
ncbi:hypothetical protein JKP88DRAFT_276492 [Tribonema minus]|uniref:ANK_REP_REGION domain-containing protein n=1 Tax=Tribonema minus TaxID=303371 RepID=A0A835ZBZ3_9STRA|nr:hypothetical protein JKP88DRAFT_276492 [Tribonema minus]